MTRWSWGIDPGSAQFAVAVVSMPASRLPSTSALHHVALHKSKVKTTKREPQRELRLADVGRIADEQLGTLAKRYPPSCIVLEQPVGRFPAPTLMGAWGALTCTVCAIAGGAAVWMTPPAWKRVAGVGGGASKLDIAQAAARLGYEGAQVDESDAVVMAWAGLLTLRSDA